ncbi:PAS domain-containing sensor histidine kinase [Labilibacter marinus]|uniref:PAS domain-containing sensor histidine kinase n=1 Tax=Labilibacter marinus TaxID=1477105 RepID=UPI0009500C82|nr:PAS domain S-box protein [Labilibacter marinus]
MKIFDVFKLKGEEINFNHKITNAVIVSLIVLIVPLIIYVHFFSGKSSEFHPITAASNMGLMVLLVLVSFYFNRIPYMVKRVLIFIVLIFFGVKAFLMGNIEFITSILTILISYTLLTSPKKVSLFVVIATVAIYISYPFLQNYKIISFYYDPIVFHEDVNMVVIRIGQSLLGVLFMAALIAVVFINNRTNITLLEKKVDEARLLNESLKQEMDDKETAQNLAIEHAHNYLTLFNNSYDGYMLLSSDYIIQDVNQAGLNVSGFSREEIVGVSCLFFLGDHYVEILNKRREKILGGEEVPDLTVEVKSKGGERLVLQTQMVVVQGSFDYKFLVVLKDVTKQTRAAEELSKNEELYRTLFEQTHDAIIIMNGNQLVEYNSVAQKLYADTNEGEILLPPYCNPNQEFEEPNASIHLAKVIQKALNGQAQIFEWLHTYGNEKPTYTLVNIQDIKLLGEHYYMVVEKDITARKMNNNMVLNSIISTEENERKRISSDLHDGIGPLLTTIKLYTEGLLDTQDKERQNLIKSKLVDLIEEAVNSISEISFNISPHILLNYGIVAAVNSFIEKFNIDERINIEFKHTDINRFSENKEITIYRLFTELINNTLKHAEASEVIFKIFENDKDIILHYADNGKGFDLEKAMLSKKGMGLGNLKSRIESFNGLFVMKSNLGKGVIVNIKIPKQDI